MAMNENKKVVVIITVALILAAIAALLQFNDKEQTTMIQEEGTQESTGRGIVGLVVLSNPGVEDKGYNFEGEEA